MIRASSLAFPGSRTLAGWWQQLAIYRPVSLSAGYIFLHRLEAPALWQEARLVDPLLLLVVDAVSVEQAHGGAARAVSFDQIQGRLRLEVGVVRRLIRTLHQANLIGSERALDGRNPSLRVSALGHEALRSGTIPARAWRREVFTFIENLSPAGERLAAPHFLRLAAATGAAWQSGAETAIDVSFLRACLAQPSAWKALFGFPQEVAAFPEPGSAPAADADSALIDRPQRVFAALVETAEQETLVFGVRPEGWTLLADAPSARLPQAAAEELGWQRAAPMAEGEMWQLAGVGYVRQANRRALMPAPVGV